MEKAGHKSSMGLAVPIRHGKVSAQRGFIETCLP